MKLKDILNDSFDRTPWEQKGYELPRYDIRTLRQKTHDAPTWLHFGPGNIFRAFPAAILNDALNTGQYDRGVIVATTHGYESIDKIYDPYDNLCLYVSLHADGSIEKKVIGSITEALRADEAHSDWQRLVEVITAPSLQMVSFTITEKGYHYDEDDLARGLMPQLAMGKVCLLLLQRYHAGALPITLQSMDNCSHNGDVVRQAVLAYAQRWVKDGLVPQAFVDYLTDETKVSYPWSMIDKITPRPHQKVKELLQEDGFEDNDYIETRHGSFTAPFVNAEETQYLVCEDHYTNGRPPLELGGVRYTDRQTVDKVETMKVTTCLNPLHTAMAIFGCMLGFDLISTEIRDTDIRMLVQKIGYIEAMPVCEDPGVLNPYEFIGQFINRRLPNPFMPDMPQRIATDTSQKLPIRFGMTIRKYIERGLDLDNLQLIPLVYAAYARYLRGLDDNLEPFRPSDDPRLEELQPLADKPAELFSHADIFGVDLTKTPLYPRIVGYLEELNSGKGAVRRTLHKYALAR